MVQLVSRKDESDPDSDPDAQEAVWAYSDEGLMCLGVWTAKRHRYGEDAEPTLLHHFPQRHGLAGVYDGLGGSGARPAGVTAPDRPVSNAFVASRLAHLAVQEWFVERRGCDVTLQDHLLAVFDGARRPGPKLRGTLSRELPTTAALVEYRVDDTAVDVTARWAGDSRCFLLTAEQGLQQISRDDSDADDALEILISDQPMNNLISADGRFHLRENRLSAELPCVLVCATDGFFHYVPTPALFEYHVLHCLGSATSVEQWGDQLAGWVRSCSADDATLAVVALGFDTFGDLRAAFRQRFERLHDEHWNLMAGVGDVADDPDTRRAALVGARRQSWDAYRPGYTARLPTVATAEGGQLVKVGETVRGFTIVAEPTTSGGGRCVWSYAERGGQQYFIKQFLDPKWPTESSMGSPASKELRRQECQAFERRHRDVNSRINGRAAGGGNLVTAVDFFRDGSTYYKVTDRVMAEPANDLTDLTDRQTAVVLRTLCHSMRLLHRAGIVHGDLKPANVLLQRSATVDLVTAKMIDFDDSYRSGDPPPPEEIVGDQKYGSPEWLRYVKEDPDVPPERLTTAVDIFALALMFHVYLTGELPGYDHARFCSPAEAVWAGTGLRFSTRLHGRTTAMLRRMTSASITDRPAIDELIALLNDENAVRVAAADVPEPRGGSRVRTTMGRAAPVPPGRLPTAPPAGGASRLRKSFDH